MLRKIRYLSNEQNFVQQMPVNSMRFWSAEIAPKAQMTAIHGQAVVVHVR